MIEQECNGASEEEYGALAHGAALIDRSERGKLALIGAGAAEFLQGQTTNDIVALRPGDGCYAAFLTPKGKMLGDLRVLALGQGEPELGGAPALPQAEGEHGRERNQESPPTLLLDCERVALQALFDMIRRYRIGYDFELQKRTLERSLLTLSGPDARRVAARAGARVAELPTREHAHLAAMIGDLPVRLIAGPAGDLDLLCASEAGAALRSALLDAGAREVPQRAYEVVRIERSIPRYGVDMDESTIPQEAGINERAVSFTKGCYVGQETVARLYYKGKPNRHLRGLICEAPVAPGATVMLGERAVGQVSSACDSPRLGPIALALLRRECEPGARVLVQPADRDELRAVGGRVVELPFK
jgi:folate-binding protein YgfZ